MAEEIKLDPELLAKLAERKLKSWQTDDSRPLSTGRANLSDAERADLLDKMYDDEEALKKVSQTMGSPQVLCGFEYSREGEDISAEEMKEVCDRWGITREEVDQICDEMWISERDLATTPGFFLGRGVPHPDQGDTPDSKDDPTASIWYHRVLKAHMQLAMHEMGTYQRPMNESVMAKGFGVDSCRDDTTEYPAGGIGQVPEKLEYVKVSKEIEKERGISLYRPNLHWHGIELGQKPYVKWKISATHMQRPAVTYDGLSMEQISFLNNAACHQWMADVQRTHIFGMDLAHRTVERRFGKEVTPDSINLYMEMHNHNIASGSLIMEHIGETDPRLVADSYVKIVTGNEAMLEVLDPQYIIDPRQLFPEYQASQIMNQIGDKLFEVARIPTLITMIGDHGTTRGWTGQQASLAFLSAYRIPAGEAVTSDFVYTVKHGDNIFMGNLMPWRRAKMVNSPGGVSFGYAADMSQGSRAPESQDPFDPVNLFLESVAWAGYYDIGYLHNYLAGGSSGWTQVMITQGFCSDIDVDFCYRTLDADTMTHFMGLDLAPSSMDSLYCASEGIVKYGMEYFDKMPIAQETLYGGLQRAGLISAVSGASTAYFCRSPTFGLPGFYHALLMCKEGWNRLGFYASDGPHQQGTFHSYTLVGEYGGPLEFRGPNYPDYNWSVGHLGIYVAYVNGVHFLSGHGYSCNPIVHAAFADPSLLFDFAHIRREVARGAVHEFMPAGERDVVIPAH